MPFKPGNDMWKRAKKKGRPPRDRDLVTMCKDFGRPAFERLTKIIQDDKQRARDHIAACNLILAYGFGRPKETVDLTQTYDITADFLDALRIVNENARPAKLLNPPPIDAAKELNLGRMPAHEVLPEGWEKD